FSTFSREAVLDGSLEKYAEKNKRRRGTETVDAAFLREIEGWRDALARNFALRNNLNGRGLNFAAYRYLLDWHRDRYVEDGPEKWSKVLYRGPGGQWHLTIDEKRRILLNSIHGVDIDPQAVEVTKLSLLLKVLEGESEASLATQLRMFQERALPDLDQNIKCGNSLIGPDFYDNEQMILLEEEEHYRINVFDWKTNFPQVFEGESPGFDAVIGNPPYVDSEWMSSHHPLEREYCTSHYEAASGNWDIFCVFIDRAISLCSTNGFASFIVPNKLGSAGYAAGARKVLTVDNRLLSIRDYSNVPVFPVAVYPIVYVAQRAERKEREVERYTRMGRGADDLASEVLVHDLTYGRYFSHPELTWPIFSDINEADPVEKMRSRFLPLDTLAEVSGAATVAEAYEIQPLLSEYSGEEPAAFRVVNSGTIDRYSELWGHKTLRYLGDTYNRPVVSQTQLSHLPARRRQQAERPKIVVAGMTKVLECVIDPEGSILAGKSTTVIFSSLSLQYLLGLLNSKLVSFYYGVVFGGNRLQGGYLRIGPPQLRTVPIRTIDFSDPEDEARHDLMVGLVERMLSLHERLAGARIGRERTVIGHQIEATDRQIDRLVYELYGLTDEEIGIVEGATAR
ncbi:MAG: Eco57I restriction-modification methylase domain-containing protein, partial [Rubrobacter sp.]|nr:Eco57I restriction-modification methylase domain-containing protein [Rubrobacter sp.]